MWITYCLVETRLWILAVELLALKPGSEFNMKRSEPSDALNLDLQWPLNTLTIPSVSFYADALLHEFEPLMCCRQLCVPDLATRWRFV